MSRKFRTTAAVLVMAPVLALGSGVAAAEPAPAPVPVSEPAPAPAPADVVQQASMPLLFPWSYILCLPSVLTLPLYFICVA